MEQLGYEVLEKDRRKRRKESDADLSSSGKKSMARRKASPKKTFKSTRVLRSSKESLMSQESGGCGLGHKFHSIMMAIDNNYSVY